VESQYFSCPSCGSPFATQLSDPIYISCKQCGAVILDKVLKDESRPLKVPPDWSFIHVGTSLEFEKKQLNVCGRIRLQLRNEYKNFWCCAHGDGTHLWLMESFASLAVMHPQWQHFDDDAKKLRAGANLKLLDITIYGEYVEKCEGIAVEGEVQGWNFFLPGFFLVQMANNAGDIFVFALKNKKEALGLRGRKAQPEELKLKNIHAWDEWK
jgi:hypothetical protein